MLTREGARSLVSLELHRRCPVLPDGDELIILDEHTTEYPWGWVFFYVSRKWHEGNPRYAIAGNGPVLVRRDDASMRFCGSARPTEHYIKEFEAEFVEASKQKDQPQC